MWSMWSMWYMWTNVVNNVDHIGYHIGATVVATYTTYSHIQPH
jgi:hypothetical protein